MAESTYKIEPGRLWRKRDILLFVLVAIIFVVIRARWIGHLLVWDEAMNLWTVRSFIAGAEGDFSDWFFRHPPLYCLAISLFAPFRTGFAERVEIWNIALGVVNLGILYILNRRIFGHLTAFFSILFLAVLPGAVFFDLWIKRDPLVVTFGLLSILCYTYDRRLWTGIFAGLALLSKETAFFYCIAIGFIWLLRGDYRSPRAWLSVVLLPLLISGGWYLWFSTDTHVSFMSGGKGSMLRGPAYYLTRLFYDCGSIGLALLAISVLFLTIQLVSRLNRLQTKNENAVFRYWALFVLVPAVTILSFLPAKVPWIVIVLYPAIATLCAQGIDALWSHPFIHASGTVRIVLIVLLSAGVFCTSYPATHYEDVLKKVDAGQYRGAAKSRLLAELVNEHVQNSDRLLLTSFHYWKDIKKALPGPIFTYYLKTTPSVFKVSHALTADQYVKLIHQYNITWALLSPEPDVADELFSTFDRKYRCRTFPSAGAYLFETRGMLTEDHLSRIIQ